MVEQEENSENQGLDENELKEITLEPVGRHKRKRLISKKSSPSSPLRCNPQNLWHLRFGHASTTALRKLKSIIQNSIQQNVVSVYEQNKPESCFSPLMKRQNGNSKGFIPTFVVNSPNQKVILFTC